MSKIKVLVVEDDPDTREMLYVKLECEGFEVQISDNGAVASQMLEVYKPRVIVTDLKMPLLAGNKLIESVREKREFDAIPIIVLTAFKRELLNEALLAGATEVLEKPVGVDQLAETIKCLLKDEKYFEATIN
ncbi:MAG TPA: response regulator [Blastocatellia bacterium]|nr:response regulator [Blastocatellia bacterium]